MWLISCNQGNYGQQGSGGNNPSGQGFGFNSPIPGGSTSNTGSTSCNNKWGGVTCLSGQNRDENFLGYLSNGSSKDGIGSINCNPSNDSGVLINMTVALNGPFDPAGNNSNLTVQIGSSQLEIAVFDSWIGDLRETGKGKGKNTTEITPIYAKFQALSGEVDGNRVHLHFIYRGNNGQKDIRIEGTFDPNIFSGKISFHNEQLFNGSMPGASGPLGNFKIATCSVFKY